MILKGNSFLSHCMMKQVKQLLLHILSVYHVEQDKKDAHQPTTHFKTDGSVSEVMPHCTMKLAIKKLSVHIGVLEWRVHGYGRYS